MTPIRIGEINSYGFTALGKFTHSYRRGIELAVDEVNARGGAAGRRADRLTIYDKEPG